MRERRFSETEITGIFKRATSHDRLQAVPAVDGGMTMAELQEIGREVGLTPEAIADAVSVLEATKRQETRGFLGLPLRLEHVIELDRPLSDDDWERTVVTLREIFDAR